MATLKVFFFIILAVVLLWLGGFFYFIYTLPTQPSDKKQEKTDAIVVWTGGGCRVATGLELLAHDLSDRLFISGVYRDSETRDSHDKSDHVELPSNADNIWAGKECILHQSKNFPDRFNIPGVKGWDPLKVFIKSCRDCGINLSDEHINRLLAKVYIGHQAKTTIGNAIETAQWAAANQIHSIRLVTSPMHMPRSLIECEQYLSNVKIIIHPVELTKFNHRHWYKDWRIAYKVSLEYSKYLSILLGLRIQRQENLYRGSEEYTHHD